MVYVTGDIHGDAGRFGSPEMKKLRQGDTLLICGDFGFIWDGSSAEQHALQKLAKKKYNICFVDGTHENFELLNSYDVSEWCGGKVHHIAGNIYHLMRGQVFGIEDLSVFTMGGGENPDLDVSGLSPWAKDEMPSHAELVLGAENLEKHDSKVDIVITHEPTGRIKEFLQLKSTKKARLTILNAYFDELSTSCEYTRWYFGSMHTDKRVYDNQIAVFEKVLNVKTGK